MKKFLLSLLLAPNLAFAQATPQAANQFWATPSSGTGYLGLRALSFQDLATIKPSGLSAASAPYSGAYLTYCESGSVLFNCSFGNALISNLPGAFSTLLAGTITVTGTNNAIGYLAPGTGAQPRTEAGKLNDFVSVKDFLTAGQPDGATDNTAQIQAAITAMCAATPLGGTLLFPPGNYVVSSVTFPCEIKIQGMGQAATYIAYTGNALQWVIPGFPAFRAGAQISGGGLFDVTMNYVSGTNNAVTVEGFGKWRMERITINNPSTGVFAKGNEGLDFNTITMNGVAVADFNFTGDLTGQTSSGAACSTGNADCSTRSDFITLRDIFDVDNLKTNTGLIISGFVATVMGEHFAFEGTNIGADISCPAGLASDLSQCPHFIFLDDFQTEFFKSYGVRASDFIQMRLNKAYLYGDASVNNVNDLKLSSVNYTNVIAGDVSVTDSFIFATQADCVNVTGTMNDLRFTNNEIYGCNINNSGAYGININPTAVTQINIAGNTFCTRGGYAGLFAMNGVYIGSGASKGNVSDNTFYGCAENWLNNASASPRTIIQSNNQGPTPPRPPPNSGSCAINNAAGNNFVSSFQANGACASGTLVFTFDNTAAGTPPNGWACDAHDLTTPANILKQSGITQTTATFAATTLTNADVVQLRCSPY